MRYSGSSLIGYSWGRDLTVVFQVPCDGVPLGVQDLSRQFLRSRTIRSILPVLIADGKLSGRRDRGPDTTSPSVP